MHSLGDLVDKLIIENIKIYNLKDKINLMRDKNDKEYIEAYEKMMILNQNRAKLCEYVDIKFNDVVSGRDSNEFLAKVRTYNDI